MGSFVKTCGTEPSYAQLWAYITKLNSALGIDYRPLLTVSNLKSFSVTCLESLIKGFQNQECKTSYFNCSVRKQQQEPTQKFISGPSNKVSALGASDFATLDRTAEESQEKCWQKQNEFLFQRRMAEKFFLRRLFHWGPLTALTIIKWITLGKQCKQVPNFIHTILNCFKSKGFLSKCMVWSGTKLRFRL